MFHPLNLCHSAFNLKHIKYAQLSYAALHWHWISNWTNKLKSCARSGIDNPWPKKLSDSQPFTTIIRKIAHISITGYVLYQQEISMPPWSKTAIQNGDGLRESSCVGLVAWPSGNLRGQIQWHCMNIRSGVIGSMYPLRSLLCSLLYEDQKFWKSGFCAFSAWSITTLATLALSAPYLNTLLPIKFHNLQNVNKSTWPQSTGHIQCCLPSDCLHPTPQFGVHTTTAT